MRKGLVAVVLVAIGTLAAGLAAGDASTTNSSPVPAAAQPAMRKYTAAMTAAGKEWKRSASRADLELVNELKAVQKTAMQKNDLDGATACADLIKQHSTGATLDPETYVGSVWHMGNEHIRLNADGTITHSTKGLSGRWEVIGDRTVAVFFDHGYIDVWKADITGKSFKAVSFKKDREYTGTVGR